MLSYRKLAMRVPGRPLHTGGNDSPRPASQRAAAFILTAAMLTTFTAPAFAGTWYIEDGNITVKAGETGNDVTQNNVTTKNDTNTIITNREDKASSNTVTIDANGKNDKVEVTLKDVNIDTSSRNKAAVSVTGEGDTNIKLNGDNALKSDIYRSGIYGSGSGSLTISGGENDSLTAQGGSGANGISSSGSLTISGGTVTANGDDGGRGISSSGSVTISGGSTVTANGGNGTISGGDGICSSGGVTISGGSTVTANGGNGGSLIGGDGIRSGGVVTISGNTVNAAGGYGGKVGGYGICSFDRVAISGGTVEAAGGNGSTGGGSGIYSSDIDLSGSLELTAKAGSPSGRALSQNGDELDLNTIKDKLSPGAKVTATNANGETKQVSIPRPVEPEKPVIPEESSSSSDGGSSAPSAPASPLPGLTVTDKSGAVISYTSTQSGNTLTV